jgi:polysaccharide deacetylase family protein (PEP-CTERM system associated)
VPRARWDDFERRVARNTDRLLEIFAQHHVFATFFVLGWVAEREPALVQRIGAAGHEIASHGFGHKLVYDQRPNEFREDVRRSKAVIEAVTGRAITGYRAPSFSITAKSLWAFDVLIEEGFLWDASVFPIRHDRYGIPSAPRHPYWVKHTSASGKLLELPASTIRLAGTNLPCAGGGYFRLLPYWWAAWGIGHVNRVEGKPVVFYLHPWELDVRQPRLQANRLSRFRHYRNLAATTGRLQRLLSEHRFDTVDAAVIIPAASDGPS